MTDLQTIVLTLHQQAATLAEVTSELQSALRHGHSPELVTEAITAAEELESLHTALLSTVAQLAACIQEPRGVG